MNNKKKMGKTAKKLMKIFIGIGVAIYGVIVYYLLHFFSLMEKYPHKDFLKIYEMANEQWLTAPGAVMPINIKTLGLIIGLTVLGGVFAVMKYKMDHYMKYDNPDTVNGDDHIMTDKEKEQFDAKFTDHNTEILSTGYKNMILSQDFRLLMDNRVTHLNNNVLCIGGSGAGKSRFFAGPNCLQANTCFCITDPKGDLLKQYGKFLEDQGYKVMVFNITDMTKSNHFNPFNYIHSEEDVAIAVDSILQNTQAEGQQSNDPFWDAAMSGLLNAIFDYLRTNPREEKTLARVMELIRAGHSDDEDEDSELDIIFRRLKQDPEHANDYSVTQYGNYSVATAKTRDNILVTATSRLRAFDLPQLKALTAYDDMDFENFGNEKRALFIVLPSYRKTFNFIVSLMYSQLFSCLYEFTESKSEFCSQIKIPATGEVIKVFRANSNDEVDRAYKEAQSYKKALSKLRVVKNKKSGLYEVYNSKKELVGHRGTKDQVERFVSLLETAVAERCIQRVPNHVRFILDEFANISPITQFPQLLATMRSYEISATIILQTLPQLKTMYEKEYQTVAGNCDTFIYLGGNETETAKWISEEMLGKRTTRVLNESYNSDMRSGSNSINLSSFELFSKSNIRRMSENECLIIIKGYPMYKGRKFDIEKHPNYELAKSTYCQFKIRQTEEHEKILKRKNRKKKPLTALAQKTSNDARKRQAEEYQNNKDSVTGKPIITDPKSLYETMASSAGIPTGDFINALSTELEEATSNILEYATSSFPEAV